MSHITDLIIIVDDGYIKQETGKYIDLERFEEWMKETFEDLGQITPPCNLADVEQVLRDRLNQKFGGGKMFTGEVYIGAFNYLNVEVLVEKLKKAGELVVGVYVLALPEESITWELLWGEIPKSQYHALPTTR